MRPGRRHRMPWSIRPPSSVRPGTLSPVRRLPSWPSIADGWVPLERTPKKPKRSSAGLAAAEAGSARTHLRRSGSVLDAEGNLVDAERELAYAEHFFRDEVATVHHAWLLVLLARIRCQRGRLEEAAATLRTAREEIGELADSGRVSSLAEEVDRHLEHAKSRAGNGAVLELPSEAELTVLRLLTSDLSTREISDRIFLSPNTVRSHTRAIYRKLGVNSRADAVARATALGLLGQAQSPM